MESKGESHKQSIYDIVGNRPISEDPFSAENVMHRVFKSIGYQLELRNEEEVEQPPPWVSADPAVLGVQRFLGFKRTPGFAMLFDSEDTQRKVSEPNWLMRDTPTGKLVEAISDNSFLHYGVFRPLFDEQQRDHMKRFDVEVYKRAFMRVCERLKEHYPDKWEGYVHPSEGTIPIFRTIVPMYEQLKREHV